MTTVFCGAKCFWNKENICTKKNIFVKHDTKECMDFVEKEQK